MADFRCDSCYADGRCESCKEKRRIARARQAKRRGRRHGGPPLSPAQRAFLRAVRDYAEPDSGWAEVELQFLSARTSDRFPPQLEATLCVNVASVLERKGLLVSDPDGRQGPELTEAGLLVLSATPHPPPTPPNPNPKNQKTQKHD